MALSETKRKNAFKLTKEFLKEKKDESGDKIKIGFMSDEELKWDMEKLPTGIIGLDILTNGGLVKGQINQIYGGESCGKTTLFYNIMGHCQKTMDDFLPAYLAAEKSLDRPYAESCGVNLDEALAMEAETAENNTDFCIKCTEPEHGIDLLIIDTLQALASRAELYKGKGETIRSTEDNSMALLPRVYSQFLRMYTSRSIGKLTMILASQVRTDLSNPMFAFSKQTGGNAIAHYNLLTIELKRAGDSEWPAPKDSMPPNSFVTKATLKKAKIMGRYRGNSINLYFYNGSFNHKFNVVALSKDLGLLDDGRSFKYTDDEGNKVEVKGRGFNDLFEKVTDKDVMYMERQLLAAYNDKINKANGDSDSGDE